MTGWDSPDDLPTAFNMARANPGRVFLQTLAQLLAALEDPENHNVKQAIDQLDAALRDVDWDAVGFVLTALNQGEEVFSCHPGNDVLLKYTPGEPRNPDQQELAF